MDKLEGSGASQMVQVIKQFSKTTPFNIELATIAAPAPEIEIKLDNKNLILDKDFILVCSSVVDLLKAGDRVVIAAINNGQQYIVFDKVVSFS